MRRWPFLGAGDAKGKATRTGARARRQGHARARLHEAWTSAGAAHQSKRRRPGGDETERRCVSASYYQKVGVAAGCWSWPAAAGLLVGAGAGGGGGGPGSTAARQMWLAWTPGVLARAPQECLGLAGGARRWGSGRARRGKGSKDAAAAAGCRKN